MHPGSRVTTRGPPTPFPWPAGSLETFSGVSSTSWRRMRPWTLLAEGAPMPAQLEPGGSSRTSRRTSAPRPAGPQAPGGGLARGARLRRPARRCRHGRDRLAPFTGPRALSSTTSCSSTRPTCSRARRPTRTLRWPTWRSPAARDQLVAARCATPDFLRVDKRSGRWFIGGLQDLDDVRFRAQRDRQPDPCSGSR